MNAADIANILALAPTSATWSPALIMQLKANAAKMNLETCTTLVSRLCRLTPEERDAINIASELAGARCNGADGVEQRLKSLEQAVAGILEIMAETPTPAVRALGAVRFAGSDDARLEAVETFKTMSQFVDCFIKWWTLVPDQTDTSTALIESIVQACHEFTGARPPTDLHLTVSDDIAIAVRGTTLHLSFPKELVPTENAPLYNVLQSLSPLICRLCNELAGKKIMDVANRII